MASKYYTFDEDSAKAFAKEIYAKTEDAASSGLRTFDVQSDSVPTILHFAKDYDIEDVVQAFESQPCCLNVGIPLDDPPTKYINAVYYCMSPYISLKSGANNFKRLYRFIGYGSEVSSLDLIYMIYTKQDGNVSYVLHGTSLSRSDLPLPSDKWTTDAAYPNKWIQKLGFTSFKDEAVFDPDYDTVIASPSPDSYDTYAKAGIRCEEMSENPNNLTFSCTKVPDSDIDVNIEIIPH